VKKLELSDEFWQLFGDAQDYLDRCREILEGTPEPPAEVRSPPTPLPEVTTAVTQETAPDVCKFGGEHDAKLVDGNWYCGKCNKPLLGHKEET